MPQDAEPRPRAASPALPVLAGLTAAEALVVLALVQGWWAAAALLHAAACGAAFLLPRDGSGSAAAGVMRAVRAMLPTLGPAAVAGGLAALILARVAPAPAPPREMPEDPVDARLAAVAVARDLPDGLLLEALGDVLRWGTPRQKAQAIGLAARDLRPGGEALLRLAVADRDPAVRERAEGLRPAAERQLVRRAEELRAAGGPSRGLARHLDRAAFSGLLDPAQEDALRAEAMVVWQRLAEAQPGDAEAHAALGRDLLALGQLGEARRALEAALALGVATPAVIGWLAECHFRARDFTALDALLQRWRPAIEAEAAGSARLASAWRLWLGAA
jgi:Flp pilus assembly protein TadD